MLCMRSVQKISRVMTRIRNACPPCCRIVELIINNYINNLAGKVWRSSAVCRHYRRVLPSTDNTASVCGVSYNIYLLYIIYVHKYIMVRFRRAQRRRRHH